ncbi:hypothetical protein OAJ94_03990 [Deltaproteobacteria bacterium]|nr:hypothetical protein [Deltaproteobacteria bacterium]
MRVLPAIIGLLFIGLSVFGAIGVSGDGNIDANVPACIPPSLCDAGVTIETLDLPTIVGWLDATTTVSWSENSAWIGVIEEGLPNDCKELPTHFSCDESDLTFVAGGPDQKEEFSWKATPGHYRFASGSDSISSSLRSNSVSYEWQASLNTTPVLAMALIGVGLLVYSKVVE